MKEEIDPKIAKKLTEARRMERVRRQLFRLAAKIAQREKAAIAATGDQGALPSLNEDEQRAFKVLQAIHDALLREQTAQSVEDQPRPIVVDLSQVPMELLQRLVESKEPWSVG